MGKSSKELLTIVELAVLLKMSPRSIYNRVRPGSKNKFPIKARRVGGRLIRFLQEDVDKYLESL